MRINKKTVIFTLILTVIILICYLLPNSNYWLNWLGILIFIYSVLVWRWERRQSYVSLYTIFLLFMILFSYGQCVMWAFGIGVDSGIGSKELFYSTGLVPNDEILTLVKWYTCISMLVFNFGALIASNKPKLKKYKWYESHNVKLVKKYMYIVGCFITVFLYPIAIISKVRELIITSSYGYNALYYGVNSTQSGYLQILMYLFFPGLLCMLIGSDFSKKTVRFVWALFSIYALFGIFSGDRGSWIYSFVILMWLLIKQKGLKINKLLKFAILGLVSLYFIEAIVNVRDAGGIFALKWEDVFSIIKLEDSPIVNVFFEMGNTMSVLTYFIAKGYKIYPYENTYLVSLLGSVSTRVLSLFGIQHILIGDWFSQSHLNLTWGTDFSMIAEAYVNGGFVGGFIYMFILGMIIGKVLCVCEDFNDIKLHPIKFFISVATAEILIGFPRTASYLIVKNFIYGVCLIVFVIWSMVKMNIFQKSIRKKKIS